MPPGVGVLNFLPGGRESAHQKNAWGFCPGRGDGQAWN